MRIVALLLLVVLTIWIAVNRQRIFLRDLKASVYRDQVKQGGVEVYFNFSNDILVQQNNPGRPATRIILQHWDKVPATPATLACLRGIVCLTPADRAPALPLAPDGKTAYDPKVTMDGHLVMFTDPAGAQLRVEL